MSNIGSSGYSGYPQAPHIPYTRGTQLSKDQFDNYLWGLMQEKALFYYESIVYHDTAQRAEIERLKKKIHELTGNDTVVW